MLLRTSTMAVGLAMFLAAGCNRSEPSDPPVTQPGPTDTGVPIEDPDPDPDPEPNPDAPRVDGIRLPELGGSHQILQGESDIRVELVGERLTGAELELGLEFEIEENTDTRIVFVTGADVAADLGERDLTVRTADGEITWGGALEVVPLTASPNGADAGSRGTPDDPFRTLTHAVSVAAPDQLVSLEPGTYDGAAGEVFPIVLDDVVVEGAGPLDTTIEGDRTTAGLSLQGTTRVVGIGVTAFVRGIRTSSGAHDLERIHVFDNDQDGFNSVFINSTLESVRIADAEFRDNGDNGFEAVSGDKPAVFSFHDTLFSGNVDRGLYAIQQSELTMTDCTSTDNGIGIELIQNASIDATNLVVSDNDVDGIEGSGSTVLTLADSEISGNLGAGIVFGGDSLTMRTSDVLNNVGDGVRIESRPTVDLGRDTVPGNNRIGLDGAVISLGDRLADDRPSGATPDILAVGLDLDLAPAQSGVQEGPGDSNSPYWRIERDGNAIDFGG